MIRQLVISWAPERLLCSEIQFYDVQDGNANEHERLGKVARQRKAAARKHIIQRRLPRDHASDGYCAWMVAVHL